MSPTIRRAPARPQGLLLSLALCAASLLPVLGASGAPESVFIPASDARFSYEGRFDRSDPSAPVAIWQGSRITIDFAGETLALRFSGCRDQCFFNAQIDGRTSIVELREGKAPVGAAFSGLGAGRHRLALFKRSEAAAGTVRFLGIDLAAGGAAWAPPRPAYRLAMEFFGDSITAGACDEDGAADQWENRRTHDNALSYGALTAAAFSADYRNIAVSGMGVVQGWVPVRASEVWDALYPSAASPRADLSAWTPNVVFVNLGENDDSFTTAHQQPFPAGFSAAFAALVREIRRSHPSAQIVILRGGMFGGARSARLRTEWDSAVAALEAQDPRVCHFAFDHWTSNHPRVADHQAMADELIAWLARQGFMPAAR